MKMSGDLIHRFLAGLSRTGPETWSIMGIVRLLHREIGAEACALIAGDTVVFTDGFGRNPDLNSLRPGDPLPHPYSYDLSFVIPGERPLPCARFLFRSKPGIDRQDHVAIQDLLTIIGGHLAMQRLSRDRIVESQTINELNLNIITTMDVRKIIRNLETAARRMIGVDDIHLFCIMNDRIVAADRTMEMKNVPRTTYNIIHQNRQLTAIPARHLRPLLPTADRKTPFYMFVPYTIRNEQHGFFLFREPPAGANRPYALTRLKFLANQGALALERIELFMALQQALDESRSLQEISRIMLTSVNLPSFLHELLKRAQQLLGFKKILCSLYNPRAKSFDRFASVGISQKKFRMAKRIHPPLAEINRLFQDRFRISSSYYIPVEMVDKELLPYELYRTPKPKPRAGNRWMNGDVFLHPVYAKNRELIALLSLDQPESGLIPTPAKVKLLESFGDSLGLMIEKNSLFTEVAQLSQTDEMTGLYNYRFMRDKVHALIEDRVSPIAFVFIDLNNFKAYNDRYGHLSGDEVLRNLSRLLERAVHSHGFAARYGGDEFILILPGADRRTAEAVVARLKRTAAADPIAVPVGFCHGLSIYPENGTDFGALIDHADRYLYRQKERA